MEKEKKEDTSQVPGKSEPTHKPAVYLWVKGKEEKEKAEAAAAVGRGRGRAGEGEGNYI